MEQRYYQNATQSEALLIETTEQYRLVRWVRGEQVHLNWKQTLSDGHDGPASTVECYGTLAGMMATYELHGAVRDQRLSRAVAGALQDLRLTHLPSVDFLSAPVDTGDFSL